MTSIHSQASIANEIEVILENRVERKRLNSEIAKLIDAIYDHAASMPSRYDLKECLQMVSALHKQLIRMRGGQPARNKKKRSWRRFEMAE
jgi:hypothetical protein